MSYSSGLGFEKKIYSCEHEARDSQGVVIVVSDYFESSKLQGICGTKVENQIRISSKHLDIELLLLLDTRSSCAAAAALRTDYKKRLAD